MVLCAAAIACAGCGAAAAQHDPVARQGTAGGITARLTLSPEPAPVMKPLRLSVALADASGRPVKDRTVTFDLSMPSMTMAPNRPSASSTGAGVYEATSILSMAGEWRLTVEIGGQGLPLTIPFTFSAQ